MRNWDTHGDIIGASDFALVRSLPLVGVRMVKMSPRAERTDSRH